MIFPKIVSRDSERLATEEEVAQIMWPDSPFHCVGDGYVHQRDPYFGELGMHRYDDQAYECVCNSIAHPELERDFGIVDMLAYPRHCLGFCPHNPGPGFEKRTVSTESGPYRVNNPGPSIHDLRAMTMHYEEKDRDVYAFNFYRIHKTAFKKAARCEYRIRNKEKIREASRAYYQNKKCPPQSQSSSST